VEQTVRAAPQAGRGESGTLRVGFVGSASCNVLPGVLRAFRERFPGVPLSLSTLMRRIAWHVVRARHWAVAPFLRSSWPRSGLDDAAAVPPTEATARAGAVARSGQAVRQAAGDLAMLARLGRDVPGFLRVPVTVEVARARVRDRLAHRDRRFLDLVDRAVYRRAESPYARLLRHAGCEPGDLRTLVGQDGVEGALGRLAQQGVYVTFDELKGRRPAVRGSARFDFAQGDFDNPLARPHFAVYTGGSSGEPSRVHRSLAFVEDVAISTVLGFDAHGLRDPRVVLWLTAPVQWVLTFPKLRWPIIGWFHLLRPLPWVVRAGVRCLALLTRPSGGRIPRPAHCDPRQSRKLAEWLAREQTKGGPIIVLSAVSPAVQLAVTARSAGIGLEGVMFSAGGEPLTEARRHHIEATGARVFATYAATEMTAAASACATPAAVDDVHFFDDRNAVIARTREVEPGGPVVDALLFSSISSSAPKLLLNAELGDYARVERRPCDCALGALGLRTHLSDIRSFEKLNSEGVSYARANLLPIVEQTLPGRFGGTSVHYQLVEEEADDTATRLVLRVDPSVGPVDETALRRALLDELARGGTLLDRYQVELLRRARSVTISRQPPVATRAGKILPFQIGGTPPAVDRACRGGRRPDD
jgi:hypothetical protein